MCLALFQKVPHDEHLLLYQTTERGRREAISKGQKEITAKLNIDRVSLCEIYKVVCYMDELIEIY